MPLGRALQTTAEQRLTRELILQLKLGRLRPSYFTDKYSADVLTEYASAWETLKDEGMLTMHPDEVRLTPTGLLRVDQLLPLFYAPEFQQSRYT